MKPSLRASWSFSNPTFLYQKTFHDYNFPWTGHQWFAYDLVTNVKPKRIVELGTYAGTSLFSFLQAVLDHSLPTQLHAIDTWKGDINAGFYNEDVYKLFTQTLSKHYPKAPVTLHRMTFAEALPEFSTMKIDILHIDGQHTYKEVKADYDGWKKLVADDGVILFHDIAEKEFDVHKVWEEAQKEYPKALAISFMHSHGLGVLFKKPPTLFGTTSEQEFIQHYEILALKALQRGTESELTDNRAYRVRYEEENAQLRDTITNLQQQLAQSQGALEQVIKKHGKLHEKLGELQAIQNRKIVKLALSIDRSKIIRNPLTQQAARLAIRGTGRKVQVPKPRVGYIIPSSGISGGVAVCLYHCNLLKKAGYDVVIILPTNEDPHYHWFDNQVPVVQYNDPEQRTLLHNLDVLVGAGFSTIPYLQEIEAARKVYFVQNDERRLNDDPEMRARIQLSYQQPWEFMTEAAWIQRWLLEEFGQKTYVVPHGIDPALFNQTDPVAQKSKTLRVLLEGAVALPYKGVTDAYNAIADLVCQKWIISHAGELPTTWKYDRYFPSATQRDMSRIFASCDIFLKMSRIEGFFSPPLEAMASGCAVVVGKVTGYDEYITHEHNALVVEKGDVVAAKKAVQRLLSDNKLRHKLIANGLKTAAQWTWAKSFPQLEAMVTNKPPQIVFTEEHPQRYEYDPNRTIIDS